MGEITLNIYMNARREHAWLLRAEGLTLNEIGKRLGWDTGFTRLCIIKFGKRMQKAMCRIRMKAQ